MRARLHCQIAAGQEYPFASEHRRRVGLSITTTDPGPHFRGSTDSVTVVGPSQVDLSTLLLISFSFSMVRSGVVACD